MFAIDTIFIQVLTNEYVFRYLESLFVKSKLRSVNVKLKFVNLKYGLIDDDRSP